MILTNNGVDPSLAPALQTKSPLVPTLKLSLQMQIVNFPCFPNPHPAHFSHPNAPSLLPGTVASSPPLPFSRS